MAAANSSRRGVANLGKQFGPQIWAHHSSPSSATLRTMHTSVYDKNVDEHVRPVVVPDEIIQQAQSSPDKYWAPNPHTGVFGPAKEHSASGIQIHTISAREGAGATTESVLEQKAFFRTLEDLDKPQHP